MTRTQPIENDSSEDANDINLLFLLSVSSINVQKIKKTVDNLYTEKQKLEKEKNKKGGKGKTKASLRKEGENVSRTNHQTGNINLTEFTFVSLQENIKEYGQYESYDYDDFM